MIIRLRYFVLQGIVNIVGVTGFDREIKSSKSRIGLSSRYQVTSALRRSFPVSTSFSKFSDLDRCYNISRVPVDNGKLKKPEPVRCMIL